MAVNVQFSSVERSEEAGRTDMLLTRCGGDVTIVILNTAGIIIQDDILYEDKNIPRMD